MAHTIVYSDALALCLLFTAVLFSFNLKNWKGRFFNPLCWGYLLTMVSSVCDIIWINIDGIPKLAPFNYLINVMEYCTFGFIGYSWLRYCMEEFPFPVFKTRTAKVLATIPVLIVSLLIVLSCRTHWVFYIDRNGFYHRGKYFFFQQIGFVYLITASVISLVSRRKCKLSSFRDQFLVMAVFSLPGIILGSFQLLMPPGSLPTLQFAVTLSLLILYANEQERRVTRDGLTKLMNRYEFERILFDRINRYRPDSPCRIYVILADLDGFKHINDTYGHLEGDKVLQGVANVLDQTGLEYDANVSRMAGDEFLIMIETEDALAPGEYCRKVDMNLRKYGFAHQDDVSISMGIACYDGVQSLQDLISAADREQYRVKNQKHSTLKQ